ncbi:alpha/beta hydrolase [Microbispora amethystogenes]|uniref:alpha/beta fold hydrolase n=1 Tax=Microbispora amethystogenes TaxID=1427754 RepID=UPI00340C555F
MSFRRVLLVVLGAVALLFSSTTPNAVAGVTAATTNVKPTVVLVHGAFADASGWNGVVARLQAAGYAVLAVANPLRDLAGDSAYVSSVLASVPGPVVLVGHSYGGAVITNAAAGNSNVKALVYVAGFAPDSGETSLELSDRFPGSTLPTALVPRPYPSGVDGYIDPAKFRAVFAADLPESTTRLMAATQRPVSVGALSGPSGAPAWRSIHSWYLVAGSDKAIPPAAQRFMAKRAKSAVLELPGASHAVMVSQPTATAAFIVAAARAAVR